MDMDGLERWHDIVAVAFMFSFLPLLVLALWVWS